MQTSVKRRFTIGIWRSKADRSETKGLITCAEPFGYHLKLGCYPDLGCNLLDGFYDTQQIQMGFGWHH